MTITKLLIYAMKSNVQVGKHRSIVIFPRMFDFGAEISFLTRKRFLTETDFETLYILVEQLETEGFNRTLFLSHLPQETISFFASLFARSQKDEYIYKLEEKLKQTENELKDMIEKRNHLELERIQLLDKVAELQIQLGMSFSVNISAEFRSKNFFLKTLKARVHQQDAKSDQNGPRRILPLQTSSPLGAVSTSKSPINRALLSPDEGIEGKNFNS